MDAVSFHVIADFADESNPIVNTDYRFGSMVKCGTDGYYSDHLLGSDVATLTPSQKNTEWSFGGEYQLPEWRSRHVYASFELRNALVYNYAQTAANPERRQCTWNLQIGRTAPPNSRIALKDYFFQVHRGVNPYGQLRSQADYWSAGFGWVFDL